MGKRNAVGLHADSSDDVHSAPRCSSKTGRRASRTACDAKRRTKVNTVTPYTQPLPTQSFSVAIALATQIATLVTAESWR
ncbi:hypothetical protein CX658_07535 [Pseudomonas amygdali pv. lachrymans]|nr:hypothetical protein CX658_07535 [Pseudomonas amygdali pv. lachrymans]